MEQDLETGAELRGQSRTWRMDQDLEDRAGPEGPGGWSRTWRTEQDLEDRAQDLEDLEDKAEPGGWSGTWRTWRLEQDLEDGLKAYADPTTGGFSSDL